MKIFNFILLLLLSLPAFGQRIYFNDQDVAFFNRQKETYQRWLDQSGLGQALRVTYLEITKDSSSVELSLGINTQDLDTAVTLWTNMGRDYKTCSEQPLGDALFLKFVQFFEIPAEQCNIQVFLYDGNHNKDRCFYVLINDMDGQTVTREYLNNCRAAQPIEIPLAPLRLAKGNKGKSSHIVAFLSTEQVFEKIERYAHQRYDRDQDGRRSVVEKGKSSGNKLNLSVEDLCKEVIKDAEKSYWCKGMAFLGIQCNDIARERLEFSFSYDDKTGALHCDLTGKFGSGVYRPRSTGWMDMEPDYAQYLSDYTTSLGEALKQYIEKP